MFSNSDDLQYVFQCTKSSTSMFSLRKFRFINVKFRINTTRKTTTRNLTDRNRFNERVEVNQFGVTVACFRSLIGNWILSIVVIKNLISDSYMMKPWTFGLATTYKVEFCVSSQLSWSMTLCSVEASCTSYTSKIKHCVAPYFCDNCLQHT